MAASRRTPIRTSRAVFARMVRTIVFLLFAAGLPPLAMASPGDSASYPLIYEVLYDPIGSDTGKEWVVLYNPHSFPVSLQNVSLQSGNGALPNAWTMEWTGKSEVMMPGSFFLIGEPDVVPVPDVIAALDLQQGPDGVRIVKQGVVVDTLGWGAHTYPEYYEGSPAPLTAAGQSLRRVSFVDTDDNSADFERHSNATPMNSAQGGGLQMVSISVQVMDTQVHLLASALTDDRPSDQVAQWFPAIGSSRTVEWWALLEHSSPLQDVSLGLRGPLSVQNILVQIHEVSEYRTNVSAQFGVMYYDPAGNYSLGLNGSSGQGIFSFSWPAKIEELLAYELEPANILFGEMQQGAMHSIQGDASMGNDLPTVRNLGNQQLDFFVRGDDLRAGNATIPSHNIRFAFSSVMTQQNSYNVSTQGSSVPVALSPGSSSLVPFSLQMYIPPFAQPNVYQGSLEILAQRG